jgi:hypothetical protein
VIHCQNDPYQPRFPAIAEVRYVGLSDGECEFAEKTAEHFASSWYRQGLGAGRFTFQADGRGSNPWAVTVRQRSSEDPSYSVSISADMGVKFYFDMGS